VKAARRPSAFTLIELLVVIAILGILAGLAVPALKNLGKANVQTSASRQLLDDIGRARQLAISDHTTVFMVFVSTNFWAPAANINWTNTLNNTQLTVVSNLLSMQMSGYTFIAYGALGDQPGQHQWHYLEPWQSLPQNFIIAPWKFTYYGAAPPQYFSFNDSINNNPFRIYPFDFTNNIPFPTETNANTTVSLPYIEFNYLGQLVSSANDQDVAGTGADIPLAQGSVAYPLNASTKMPALTSVGPNAVAESPPGNSTNITYNIVHIDALTGRATLEYHQVQGQ
jgi:prepilin-type N-terminal cleavage/methylation domain-containing protein